MKTISGTFRVPSSEFRNPRRWPATLGMLGWLIWSLRVVTLGAELPEHRWNFGFSSKAFIGINENDAKASIRVWAQTVARENHMEVNPETKVYQSVAEINQALHAGVLDMVVVSTPDYFVLDPDVQPQNLISHQGRIGEEYLLLVSKAAGITNVAGLGGRTLKVLDNIRSSLAVLWLDTLLMAQSGAPTAENLGKVQLALKPSQVVLPVFFGKADACLISVAAFETMAELNPQLNQRLHVLARSPRLVPVFLGLRPTLTPDQKEFIRKLMTEFHETAAGEQILALFRGQPPLAEIPLNALDTARDLLDRHKQLLQQRKTAASSEPP